MKRFKFRGFCLSLFISASLLSAETKDSNLGDDIEYEIRREPLFVSLGSFCTTARMQRECGIRKAAFPFDWIISFDGEKLIELLEEDFLYFLNVDMLKISGQSLLNLHYHLEFLNEGDWEDANYNVKEFTLKCQRRIDRFRQLANYPGKVFFVRTAQPLSLSDPHRIWKFEENVEISYNYAEKLNRALRNYFPKLDFTLIIINGYDKSGFSIEASNSILMVRIDDKIDSYREFYSHQILRDREHSRPLAID